RVERVVARRVVHVERDEVLAVQVRLRQPAAAVRRAERVEVRRVAGGRRARRRGSDRRARRKLQQHQAQAEGGREPDQPGPPALQKPVHAPPLEAIWSTVTEAYPPPTWKS